MKLPSLALAALLAATLCPLSANAATPRKDPWCPAAVQKLDALDEVAGTNDPQKIEPVVRAIVDAYLGCSGEAQLASNVEPAMNYDKTRAAQYGVVLARSLAAQGKTADAIAVYRAARKNADDVATWVPSALRYTTSNTMAGTSVSRNTGHNVSNYKDAATAVRDAIDAELVKLGASPAAASASAAPAPSPSP